MDSFKEEGHFMRKLFRIFLAAMLLLCTVRSATLAHAQQTAVPEEARRYYVQANTLFRTAQSKTDFQQAAAMYRQALAVDPQYGNAWYNLSKVQEKLEQYDDAIASLKQFLAVSPNDPEARAAQDHEYELEALKGKAESPEAMWAKFLQSLEGGIWWGDGFHDNGTGANNGRFVILIQNGQLIHKTLRWADGAAIPDPSQMIEEGRVEVTGRQFTYTFEAHHVDNCSPTTVAIADGGERITESGVCRGRQWTETFERKR